MISSLRFLAVISTLVAVSCFAAQAQSKQNKMFQKGTLAELNQRAIQNKKDFFFFIWEDENEALTSYYRDTVFANRAIANQMKDRFICVSAQSTSDIGISFSKQLRHTEFPAMMFVGWKKGDELYSLEGKLETDQVLDQLERIDYRKP